MIKFLEYFKKIFIIILILFICNFLSAFIWGTLLSIGGNIKVIGLNEITFDPLITIAYIILYYTFNIFYTPNIKAQYWLFLFILFLSFTVNFIQGAVYLVFLYAILRWSKFI